VISKPLVELPPNFEIGYTDKEFSCFADVAGISDRVITDGIIIRVGVTTGTNDATT
jgi:hypothetical protein